MILAWNNLIINTDNIISISPIYNDERPGIKVIVSEECSYTYWDVKFEDYQILKL